MKLFMMLPYYRSDILALVELEIFANIIAVIFMLKLKSETGTGCIKSEKWPVMCFVAIEEF
ncbi:MAG: hypothetical protein A2X82_02070 [Geobacteraceae bacterium GWC2_55_20]|nr:MAG: hypothetical protein A2X82_02070 [Geobacteraceae bacterium GWC2_55_20]HCE67986.1 hypothetical protein [Geobacter sp.]